MKILLLLFSVSLLSASFTRFAFAGEEKHAEKSEKKEEGGEKKEGVSEADSMPWLGIEAKIQELASRIESKKESLTKLLEEKEKLKDNSPELKDKIQEIISEHKELSKLGEEYSAQLNLLKYRYPERHAKRDAKKDQVEIKSVEDMEQAVGVDGKLNRNMSHMRTAYDARPVKNEKADSPVPAKTRPPTKSDSLENQLPIIMQK
jgi:TolA-binding protein